MYVGARPFKALEVSCEISKINTECNGASERERKLQPEVVGGFKFWSAEWLQ